MATLLIELEGPMQSWGLKGRFSEKDTALEPSKSGVIGLIAAALGRSRDDDMSDLAELNFAVRVDWQGTRKKEFQTAQNIIKAEKGIAETQLVIRYYLSDARFIAGLEGDISFLNKIRTALLNPVYMPFLGRRSYVPSVPLINPKEDNLTAQDLHTAIINYPYKYQKEKEVPEKLRVVRDSDINEESVIIDYRQDAPVSFSKKEYLVRKVITEWIDIPLKKEVA